MDQCYSQASFKLQAAEGEFRRSHPVKQHGEIKTMFTASGESTWVARGPSVSSPVAVVLLLPWPHSGLLPFGRCPFPCDQRCGGIPARVELTQAGGLCKVTSASACFLLGKRGGWDALSLGVGLGLGF